MYIYSAGVSLLHSGVLGWFSFPLLHQVASLFLISLSSAIGTASTCSECKDGMWILWRFTSRWHGLRSGRRALCRLRILVSGTPVTHIRFITEKLTTLYAQSVWWSIRKSRFTWGPKLTVIMLSGGLTVLGCMPAAAVFCEKSVWSSLWTGLIVVACK